MASLTLHSKQRIRERVDSNLKKIALFKCALRNGKSIADYEGKFAQYLKSKSKRAGIKVYRNDVYIYSKNNKRLITVFPVPKKYLPLENYIHKNL